MTLQMRDRENIERGIEQGIEQGRRGLIIEALKNGTSPETLINVFKIPEKEVYKIAEDLKKEN